MVYQKAPQQTRPDWGPKDLSSGNGRVADHPGITPICFVPTRKPCSLLQRRYNCREPESNKRDSRSTTYKGNKTVDTHVRVMYHFQMDAPETLQKAIAHFSDPENAFKAAVEFRWPGGNVTCPRCNGAKHSFIKTRRIWFCYDCKKQFTVKVGTIFEDSPLGMDKWMIALWMLANCKNGISSYELAKVLGIRQNSAWFMLHRIREAMKDDPRYKFGGEEGGPVESDETFIGPNPYKMHKSRKSKVHARDSGNRHYVGKTAVFGVLDRDLRQVRSKVIPDVKRETLQMRF